MFVVVSYDIVDDKKRGKMSNLLKDYGTRVQYSVFECDIEGKYLEQLVREALKFINPDEDSLKIYQLCQGCLSRIESHGRKRGVEGEERDVMVV